MWRVGFKPWVACGLLSVFGGSAAHAQAWRPVSSFAEQFQVSHVVPSLAPVSSNAWRVFGASGEVVQDGGQVYGSSTSLVFNGETMRYEWVTSSKTFMTAQFTTGAGVASAVRPFYTRGDVSVRAFNGAGTLVGTARKSSLSTRWVATVWLPGKAPADIGAGADSVATGVNAAGLVLGEIPVYGGSANRTPLGTVPFLWKAGALQRLSPLPGGAQVLQCQGPSDAGDVVCTDQPSLSLPARAAYVWQGGRFNDIRHPSGQNLRLDGITAGGMLWGRVVLAAGERCFVYKQGEFSMLPDDWAQVHQLNDGGFASVSRWIGPPQGDSGARPSVMEFRSLSGSSLPTVLESSQRLPGWTGTPAVEVQSVNARGDLLVRLLDGKVGENRWAVARPLKP